MQCERCSNVYNMMTWEIISITLQVLNIVNEIFKHVWEKIISTFLFYADYGRFCFKKKKKNQHIHSVIAENSQVIIGIDFTLISGSIYGDRQRRHG